MVREVPDYARQYLIEHPELGPPISDLCGADTPAREAKPTAVARIEEQAEPAEQPQNLSQESATIKPAAKRRQNAAHGASRGTRPENNPAPQERKNPCDPSPDHEPPDTDSKEYERIMQAQTAIPGAMAGNWRDLRTVFEFAGICEQDKEAPS